MDVGVLLVGGGIASATAARALRDGGFEGSVLLVGRELDPPYHRPPLSKQVLQGLMDGDQALVHPPAWWREAEVELRTRTNVLGIDAAAKIARLQGGAEVRFGQALLATGAMVRRLQVEGADLDGIHYLRALGNAEAIRRDTEDAEGVVCVGGSYIGCEVAASLTVLGKRVTVVMQEAEPCERALGATAGRAIRRVLETHGIEVVGEAEVQRLAGEGRVDRVVLGDGRELPCEAVVCGIGAVPDVMLARKGGMAIGDLGGVRCDDALRTSAHGVWAAGDVCEYDSVLHGRTVRIEHEDVAACQGAHAARGMLGDVRPYDVVPWFWSDLADWARFEHLGPALDADGEEVEGDPEGGAFTVRHLRGGRLVGVTTAGGHADLDAARAELQVAAGIQR